MVFKLAGNYCCIFDFLAGSNCINLFKMTIKDIVKLDDKSIQRVLREVDNNSIALALKGVKVDVQEAIFRNLSSRLADMIREDMEYMGPVRIKDVEEVQQGIVDKVRELEERGEIVIARAGGDEVIV